MTNNTPEWVRQHNQSTADIKGRAQAAKATRLMLGAVLQEHGPDFWKRFVDRVTVNARAVQELDGEELVGHTSVSTDGREAHCFIQVNRQSVRYGPELSKMNLWYAPGGAHIRCWYQDKELNDIILAVRGDEVLASLSGNVLTAEQLADHIVQWMATQVMTVRG